MSTFALVITLVGNLLFYAFGFWRGRVSQMRDEMKFLKRLRATK